MYHLPYIKRSYGAANFQDARKGDNIRGNTFISHLSETAQSFIIQPMLSLDGSLTYPYLNQK